MEASTAIARRHQLQDDRVVFAKQNPAAIDAGAFHNDVVAVGNENVLLMHAAAFENAPAMLDEIRRKFAAVCDGELFIITAADEELSLADAVESYIFNSQLITLPNGTMSLIAPSIESAPQSCAGAGLRAARVVIRQSDQVGALSGCPPKHEKRRWTGVLKIAGGADGGAGAGGSTGGDVQRCLT